MIQSYEIAMPQRSVPSRHYQAVNSVAKDYKKLEAH